jgi:hypothetical protein
MLQVKEFIVHFYPPIHQISSKSSNPQSKTHLILLHVQFKSLEWNSNLVDACCRGFEVWRQLKEEKLKLKVSICASLLSLSQVGFFK